MIMKTYACIMAGGSGERFWPLSRIARPKHLVPLLSEVTLLEETVRRVEQALPSSHIFVLTNAAQIEGCRAVLPQLEGAPIHRGTGQARYGAGLRAGHGAGAQSRPGCGGGFPAGRCADQGRGDVRARSSSRPPTLAAKHDTIVTFGIRPRSCLDALWLSRGGRGAAGKHGDVSVLSRWSGSWRSRTRRGRRRI